MRHFFHLLLLFSSLLLVPPGAAQTRTFLSYHGIITETTVAALPASGNWTGRVFFVSDGATETDCTTGSGAQTVFCMWDGSNWSHPGGDDLSNDSITALSDVAAKSGTGTTVLFQTTPTITSPVLTAPTIVNYTNATHNHEAAAGGGQLVIANATTGDLPLNTRTSGAYVDGITSLTDGLSLTPATSGDAVSYSLDFGYPSLASNPDLAADTCAFGSESLHGIICEGSVDDTFEGFFTLPDVTGSDQTIAILTENDIPGSGNEVLISDGAGGFRVSATGYISTNSDQTLGYGGSATGSVTFDIGSKSSAQIAGLDFNTSGQGNDYDARLLGSGGTASTGQGNILFYGGKFVFFAGPPDLADPGTKPTCNSTNRGIIWFDEGATSVADTVEMCGKNSSDVYAWVALATF